MERCFTRDRCIRSGARSTLTGVSEPLDDEAEVIDGLPVLGDDPRAVEEPALRSRALTIRLAAPVQAVTAAVGGFLAGIAVVGLLSSRNGRRSRAALARRMSSRRLSRGPAARGRRAQRGSRRGAGELVQVVASRSLLVDVHLLGSPGDER